MLQIAQNKIFKGEMYLALFQEEKFHIDFLSFNT